MSVTVTDSGKYQWRGVGKLYDTAEQAQRVGEIQDNKFRKEDNAQAQ